MNGKMKRARMTPSWKRKRAMWYAPIQTDMSSLFVSFLCKDLASRWPSFGFKVEFKVEAEDGK